MNAPPVQPSQTEGFVLDIPADQADYLDGPLPQYADPKDTTAMASIRKYEQSLAARGVKLETPTFPELFATKE
jgi:hypothetical protein